MYAELYWAAEDGIAAFLTPGQVRLRTVEIR